MDDKLLKHTSIIASATIASLFFAYLFHFYMARALGPADYGALGALLSIFYIFSVPGNTIATTIAHLVSELNANGNIKKIKTILLISSKKLALLGLLIFAFLTISSIPIKNLLKFSSALPVLFLGTSLVFFTILPSPRGVLQGMQNFNSLGINIALEKIFLLTFGVALVSLGFGLNGAVLAYVFASFSVLVLAFFPLRLLVKETPPQTFNIDVMKYTSPVFILFLCITVMSSVDVLFVKRYFASEIAGYFVAMSMLGKVIYFSAGALGSVLLPKVAGLNSIQKAHSFLLKKALAYFSIGLIAVLGVYYLFSELILDVLFGKPYTAIASYLAWYALAFGLLSLSRIFMFYDISVKKTAFKYPLIFFTILEIILLTLFHETIAQIIAVLIGTFSILLITTISINSKINI